MSSLRLTLMLGVAAVLSACALDIPTNIPRDGGPDRPDLGACGTEGLRCCTGTYDMDAGATCMGSLACVSNRCMACPAGQTLCNGTCVPLTTTDNCGMCGRRCDNGFTCDPVTSVVTPGMDGGVVRPGDAGAGGDAGAQYACQVLCRAPTADRCGSACTSVSTDPNNCGSCGNRCQFTSGIGMCMGGTCMLQACNTGFADCDMNPANGCEVQVNGSDANNCGTCMNRCTFPHAAATCAAGTCRMGACMPGFADCNMNPIDGCEVQINGGDINNCNGCGMRCPPPASGLSALCRPTAMGAATGVCDTTTMVVCPTGRADCDSNPMNGCEVDLNTTADHCGTCPTACNGTNGTRACTAGSCQISCNAGFDNCDRVVANGCEVNLSTSTANCGGCGRVCSLFQAATHTCAMGTCQVGTCNTGFANCDMSAATGCETNLNIDPNNCGACGRACAVGQSCQSGTCRIVCPPGQTECSGRCYDLTTDVGHCGVCTTACSAPTGSTASCVSGMCRTSSVVCTGSQGNCDGNDANGCEVNDVDRNVARCGQSCTACSTNHGSASCTSGVCGITCSSGFNNCDGLVSNGCETDLTTTSNCGRCGNVCSLFQATAACTSGACAVASCNAGFANCNAMAADGCETSIFSNNTNCGGCGVTCTGGKVCSSSGSCVCPTGQIDCSGTCRANQTDNLNCGTCGNTCVGGSACSAGVCACASGLTLCGSGASAVCRDRSSDVNNCGTCGNVCTGGKVCSSGSCVCPTGQTDCAGTCRNLQSDTANCGVCARACLSGQVCNAGTCGTICGGGSTNCSDMCIDVTTNTSHCGGCGMACSTTNVTAACVGSNCTGTCTSGFGDCDSNRRTNGCETNIQTSTTHCGACGTACSTANISAACSGGNCTGTCTSGFGDCDGDKRSNGCETNTQTSATSCGACGTACSTANISAACSGGNCTGTCTSGFGDCDSDKRTNGCETNTQTSALNCGTCGSACSTANITRACTGGACTGACNSGFGDCNGDKRIDGCETPLNSATNCGACGAACVANATTTAGCATSRCTCVSGNGDCDSDRGNGCETPLNTASNCGGCGVVCSGGTPACGVGGCVAACGAAGQVACAGATPCTGGATNCSGTCRDLTSDDNNCNACGMACMGRTICSASMCLGCGTEGGGICHSGAPCEGGLMNCSGVCRTTC